MKKSPSAEIIHISTPHDIQDIYGKEAFKAYVIEELGNGLAIRSKSVFLDGTPSNCTPYELGEVWDMII